LGDIGRRVARFADLAIFVGENADFGAAGAREVGGSRCQVAAFRSLSECAAFLAEELREGDLVLLKGRNADHLSRIYWELQGPIACHKTICARRTLCDRCPELGRQSVMREQNSLGPLVSPPRLVQPRNGIASTAF